MLWAMAAAERPAPPPEKPPPDAARDMMERELLVSEVLASLMGRVGKEVRGKIEARQGWGRRSELMKHACRIQERSACNQMQRRDGNDAKQRSERIFTRGATRVNNRQSQSDISANIFIITKSRDGTY